MEAQTHSTKKWKKERKRKKNALSSQVDNFPPNKSTYFPPNMRCNHFHVGLPLKPIYLLIFQRLEMVLVNV